jgi:hypothetical protein
LLDRDFKLAVLRTNGNHVTKGKYKSNAVPKWISEFILLVDTLQSGQTPKNIIFTAAREN